MKVPRQRSNGYEEFGFTLAKHNNKYVAICKICNRTLQNTAFIRLRGHRNVCRPPALDRSQLCSLYTAGNETLFVANPNENLPHDVGSQLPFDCLNQKSKLILPVVKNDFPEAKITYPPYYNAEEGSARSQARKKQTSLKKLAVLEIIKQHKHTLFEDMMADSAEIWMKVLRKAQSLGLASDNQHWTFARDSFEMWKNRTLAKKDCLDSDEWNDKLDIVDMAVLQILDKSPISMDSEPNTNSSCSAEYDHQNEDFPDVPLILPANYLPNVIVNRTQKMEDVSTQTSDELYEAEVRKKRLECEVLELEVYKKRLEALKLERELSLPPSTNTTILFPESHYLSIPNECESKDLKRRTHNTENVKFEIWDDD